MNKTTDLPVSELKTIMVRHRWRTWVFGPTGCTFKFVFSQEWEKTYDWQGPAPDHTCQSYKGLEIGWEIIAVGTGLPN